MYPLAGRARYNRAPHRRDGRVRQIYRVFLADGLFQMVPKGFVKSTKKPGTKTGYKSG